MARAASLLSTRRRSTWPAAGRTGADDRSLNYDFWYQPRKNVLVSTEFGEPNAYEPGFDLEDVEAGRYGQQLHFWNLAERTLEQTIDFGEQGLVPLEIRWLHDPDAEEGFVGAALSSVIWRFTARTAPGRPIPSSRPRQGARGLAVPGARPDHRLVLSMDDRCALLLELAPRRRAAVRRLRPGEPEADGPALARRLLGKPSDAGRELEGGPQMLQLSLDGQAGCT